MPAVRLKGLIRTASPGARFVRQGDSRPAPDPADLPIEIGDARQLQAEAESVAALFARRGFALLEHRAAPADWRDPEALARLYHPEVDALLRDTLFRGRRVEIWHDKAPVYRGEDGDADYGEWVHQDYGLTASAFATNLAGYGGGGEARAERWRTRYAQDDVEGSLSISCWRTMGMREPLRHLPMALCDPGTVAMDDLVVMGVEAESDYQIGLRFNPAQRWYHYPRMTADELLTFKLFECAKDDPGPSRLRSTFHTAFEDPDTPVDAERRRSWEHRVIVMLLRD